MIRRVLCLQAAMILFAGSAYAQGKPNKCTAPRLQWELVGSHPNGQPSGIRDGDGKGVYKDGTDGVGAVLELCAVGKDAVLDAGDRKIAFALSGITGPHWNATGTAFLRIANIRGHLDASQEGEFTTWMTTNPPSSNRKFYKFRMVNPDADYIQQSYAEEVNQPYLTAKVNVYHCPASNPTPVNAVCAGLTKETWFVYSDPAYTTHSGGTPAPYRNVGMLLDVTKAHAPVILGQFEAPFYFVISIQ